MLCLAQREKRGFDPVVADNEGIFRSDDSGSTWAQQSIEGFHDYVMKVSAVNTQKAWASTVVETNPLHKGHILHMADDGKTWMIQATPVKTNW